MAMFSTISCAKARPLSVDADMRPVVDFLRARGVPPARMTKLIAAHPPVLSYSVPSRLAPLFDYLESLGVEDPCQVRTLLCCVLWPLSGCNLRHVPA